MKAPDVNKHFVISCIKSIVRICACILALVFKTLAVFAIGILVAELLGIVEELL